jgi:UPF0716 protein FxsA
MFGRALFALFIVVPLIEIGLFAFLGQTIGVLPTLLGVLVTAVAGSLLIRWQGLKVLRDLQATMARGELPARQVGDAMLIGLGGLLLLLPGYFSDLIGLLLLMPFVRTMIYGLLARRIKVVTPGAAPSRDPRMVDLDQSDWRER